MENITIPLKQYEELIEIKGRYKELKEQNCKCNKSNNILIREPIKPEITD